jgi:GTPase SAR1 family protein
MPKIYRIVPLGPTGSGKSQLCNFIYQDESNKKFKVSNRLHSETKVPQIESCFRKINDKDNINIELVDTAGCSDSAGSDEENFKELIDKLRIKKSIDLFLLVFNFTNRIDGKTKDYMKLIANTFTPTEFFNHLAIIFTFYPEYPSDTQIKKKEKITSQIIGIIKDTIGLADGQTTFCPTIYELDTEKKNGDFI